MPENFLVKFWKQMLLKPGHDNLVYWYRDRFLVITDPKGLMKVVYEKKIARSRSYASFGRQLRIYGFNRDTETDLGFGSKTQIWRHPYLTRNSSMSEVEKQKRRAPQKVRRNGRNRSRSTSSLVSYASMVSEAPSWVSYQEDDETSFPSGQAGEGGISTESEIVPEVAAIENALSDLELSPAAGSLMGEEAPAVPTDQQPSGSNAALSSQHCGTETTNLDSTLAGLWDSYGDEGPSPLNMDDWQMSTVPSYDTWSSEPPSLPTIDEEAWSAWGIVSESEVSQSGWY